MDIRKEQGLRPGGFGILLAQRIIDELTYREKGNEGEEGNEVLLIKYLYVEELAKERANDSL
jgi:anti-sigma regulatory factor (Ser/Thr protein kinase)